MWDILRRTRGVTFAFYICATRQKVFKGRVAQTALFDVCESSQAHE
jgi:hypothetical protein